MSLLRPPLPAQQGVPGVSCHISCPQTAREKRPAGPFAKPGASRELPCLLEPGPPEGQLGTRVRTGLEVRPHLERTPDFTHVLGQTSHLARPFWGKNR